MIPHPVYGALARVSQQFHIGSNCRLRLIALAFALLSLHLPSARAQMGTISGKVIDARSGDAIPSSVVTVIDTFGVAKSRETPRVRGRMTNSKGAYVSPALEPGTYLLRARSLGYRSTERMVKVEADKATDITLSLVPDPQHMEDVVVTGVASSGLKSRAGVSVSHVDAEEVLQGTTVQDLGGVLQGRVPGVHVSTTSGNVGAGMRFDVRGTSGLYGGGQPLIIVDGAWINNAEYSGNGVGGQGTSTLADLNSEDIASVDVLKGPAATSMYGTAGVNGVVIIKTKRGTPMGDRQYSMDYKHTTGWNEPIRLYTPDMFITYQDINDLFQKGWFNENTLSFTGAAGSAFTYFTSYERRSEDGVLPNSNFQRNSFRANINATPTEDVKLGANANYIWSVNARPQDDNNILGYLGNTILATPKSVGGSGPYALTSRAAIDAASTTTRQNRFIGSVTAEYSPLKDLTFAASLGFDGTSYLDNQVLPASFPYSVYANGFSGVVQSTVSLFNSDIHAQYFNALASNLKSTTTLGVQSSTNTNRTVVVSKETFPSGAIVNIGSGTKLDNADLTVSDTRTAGLYLDEALAYDDTYFLNLGGRYDYATTYGLTPPTVIYPHVSGTVRLDKLLSLGADLNIVKFRAAYGVSGNLPGLNDGLGLTWQSAQLGVGSGATPLALGNPGIRGERIGEMELGLDLEFRNSYGIEFTYFRSNGNDAILYFPQAPSTGLPDIPRNVGSITGWGFESNIYATFIRSTSTELTANAIINYYDNEVKDLGGAPPILTNTTAIQVGLPRRAFYMFPILGAKFNSDGTYGGVLLDTARAFIGRSTPLYSGSFGLKFRFLKDFTLSSNLEFATGFYSLNYTASYAVDYGNNAAYNHLIQQLGMSGSFGIPQDSTITQFVPKTPEYIAAANQLAHMENRPQNWIQPADFIALRELSLQYDLTEAIHDLIPAYERQVHLTLGARNIWFSTKAKDNIDPDVRGNGTMTEVPYNFATLQHLKSYFMSISLGF